MISNDTSTFLRAFPKRRAWYETFQHNFKGNRLTPFGTKGVVITLWNLTKKYETALNKKDVVPIKEAEVDREEIAEAYRVLETPWERNLDGRFYFTLATMQHYRDSQIAAPELAPEEWISHFATEVKQRATPLLFLISPEHSIPLFNLPQPDVPVARDQAPTREAQQAMKRLQVRYEELPFALLDARRKELVKRLDGKRFKYSELSDRLTNWELDLLSQMIRDSTLPATFDKTTVTFRAPNKSRHSKPTFSAIAIAVKNYEEVHRR
ncbi:MAG: hypothetical protein ACFFD8_10955 [Candidatus Thorarchaeota archaeon]